MCINWSKILWAHINRTFFGLFIYFFFVSAEYPWRFDGRKEVKQKIHCVCFLFVYFQQSILCVCFIYFVPLKLYLSIFRRNCVQFTWADNHSDTLFDRYLSDRKCWPFLFLMFCIFHHFMIPIDLVGIHGRFFKY